MSVMTTKQFNAKVSVYYEVQILNMINMSTVSGTARWHPYFFNTFNGDRNSLSQQTTAMVDAGGGGIDVQKLTSVPTFSQ